MQSLVIITCTETDEIIKVCDIVLGTDLLWGRFCIWSLRLAKKDWVIEPLTLQQNKCHTDGNLLTFIQFPKQYGS